MHNDNIGYKTVETLGSNAASEAAILALLGVSALVIIWALLVIFLPKPKRRPMATRNPPSPDNRKRLWMDDPADMEDYELRKEIHDQAVSEGLKGSDLLLRCIEDYEGEND